MSIDRSVSNEESEEARAVRSNGFARRYALDLLAEAGASRSLEVPVCAESDDPAAAWADSGAMALTGLAAGPPLGAPAPLATAAEGALLAFRAIAGPRFHAAELSGAAMLGERAAIAGFGRRGSVAPGGSCRLLPAREGWLAVNLARPADREMLPAWLEADVPVDRESEAVGEETWATIGQRLVSRAAASWLERARLMGLPVADVPDELAGANGRIAGVEFRDGAKCSAIAESPAPRVLDLSTLWAGPLCGSLLAMAGADVAKCESVARPDGSRRGPAAFHDLMNGGKRSVALDFRSKAGRASLAALVSRADIVIESARPRALRGLGIDAERWIEERAGRTWISITGYGRGAEEGQWVAFGDDATAASGLSWALARAQGFDAPLFCGDALADPLTGLHAAVFALANHDRGDSRLIALSLRGVVASILELTNRPPFDVCVSAAGLARSSTLAARAPRARIPTTRARALGVDTESLLADWDVSP